jgi:Putative zinc-finger
MEHAPLRPVPARPAGPIDPAVAVREVGAWLPELPPAEARSLALVVLAERPRAEVAILLGVSEEELGRLLAAARKELRQTQATLGGSGWCERAEGLISDRLDGALAERDDRRLDVHLRNCTRCVEHERRLVQATDALVTGLGGRPAPSATAPAPLAEAPRAEAPPAHGSGEEAGTGETALPTGDAASPAGDAAPSAGQAAPGADAPPATEGPTVEGAPTGGEIAAAAEVLVAVRTRRQIAAAVVWNSMIAIAVLLTLATIALTIAGILGAHL